MPSSKAKGTSTSTGTPPSWPAPTPIFNTPARRLSAVADPTRAMHDVILDTNAVLDWLVFEDPAAEAFGAAVRARQLRWIVTPQMCAELLEVLDRLDTHPPLQRWQSAREPALAEAHRWMRAVDTPEPLSAAWRLHCTDPDDQCFIDLALARGTPWLITRDRALLRLAGRARRHGVSVLTPQRWNSVTAGTGIEPSGPRAHAAGVGP